MNQGLEGGRCIDESKGHDLVLEVIIVSMEGSFLNVILMNSNLIISPVKVDLAKDRCTLKLVNEVINERDSVR